MTAFCNWQWDDFARVSDKWPALNADQRIALAARVDSTVSTIERHLQMFRKFRDLHAIHATMQQAKAKAPAALPPATKPTPQFRVPRAKLRAAVFDLECTYFSTDGYAGLLICCSVLPLDTGKVYTLSLRFDEQTDDRRLVREVIADLAQYDILIGHNIAAFDLNWLMSRWWYHTMRGSAVGDWPRWLYFDTFQHAKSLAVKTRKGLGNLMAFLGIEGIKTSIYKADWHQMRSPYEGEWNTAMSQIIYHCEEDVKGNRKLFDALWPLAKSTGQCPVKQTKLAHTPGYRLQLPAEVAA